MILDIKLQFIYAAQRKQMFLAEYKSSIQNGGYDRHFNLNDFDKTSYALKVLNEEFEAAMIRANNRLLANELGEGELNEPPTGTGAGVDVSVADLS